jgi:hypothetical protein
MPSGEEKPAEPPPESANSSAETKKMRNQRGGGGYRKPHTFKTALEGKCDELKGYVYDCTGPSKAADMYTKTTREIAEYIGRTIKYAADVVKGIESLKEPVK